ncbi:MAG: sigma-54 dependent transcriptional regulator [Candidatus Omnitrophica bacterium]|nr:sigma-54 dependent transcriptional regulator [Candidatus Omnitrophota bacterium]
MMTRKILIIEDDQLVRDSLFEILSQEGYTVTLAETGEHGLEKLAEDPPDIALIDLRLPGMTGMDVLNAIIAKYPSVDSVMMTSFATAETAVEAMKAGAKDYLVKPINDDELKILLARIADERQLRHDYETLKMEVQEKRSRFHQMIGEDPKMQKIYSIIQAISDTTTTVLLKGESGTGKGLIAQAIHYSDPSRKDGPYVEISCGAIPRELLESELFGHVKGAFTSAIRDRVGRFELANGGTILLDEIDTLPPYLQVKLLRVLQQKVFEMVGDTKTRQVDVRIIASTNRNLEEEIKKGNFREDLYYRLNVITIEVPPLRDRKGDIPALVKHFLTVFSEKTGRPIKGITKEAMKTLIDYHWPGNVRELENTLERAVVLSDGELITPENLPDNITQESAAVRFGVTGQGTLKEVLKVPEKQIILQALDSTGWNRKKAAELLAINRTTLYNKMKEYNLL